MYDEMLAERVEEVAIREVVSRVRVGASMQYDVGDAYSSLCGNVDGMVQDGVDE